MKIEKHIFLFALFTLFIISTSFSSPIQTESSSYDLLSPGIFPYFSYLYEKKLSSTLLLFPDWSENNNKSFLTAGKKDKYGTFNDLYLTGQYKGDPNITGVHVDNIQIQNTSDSSNNVDGSNISYHHRYDNKGRFGVWYLTNSLKFLSGISAIFNFNQLEYDSFNYTSSDYKYNVAKYNNFYWKLISHLNLFNKGTVRTSFKYSISAHRNKELDIESITPISDTTFSDVIYNGKSTELSIGYLLNNAEKRNTFFINGGYSASFSENEEMYEYDSPLSTYDREISSLFIEAYDAKKLSVDKLDIYMGAGGSFRYILYIYDKGNLSFFKKFKEYHRDDTEYRLNLFLPLFLEYTIKKNFSLFSSWKPSFSHCKYLYGSDTDYAESIETKLNFTDASLGISLTIKERFKFFLIPNFSESLKLTGIEANVYF